jgi:hypothetical protein
MAVGLNIASDLRFHVERVMESNPHCQLGKRSNYGWTGG